MAPDEILPYNDLYLESMPSPNGDEIFLLPIASNEVVPGNKFQIRGTKMISTIFGKELFVGIIEKSRTEPKAQEDANTAAALQILQSLDLPIASDTMQAYEQQLRIIFPLKKSAKNLTYRLNEYSLKIQAATRKNPNLDFQHEEQLLIICKNLLRIFQHRLQTYEAPFVLAAVSCFLSELDAQAEFVSEGDFKENREVLRAIIRFFNLEKDMKDIGKSLCLLH